jgi:dCTP deaminase
MLIDTEIAALRGMITPFEPEQVKAGNIGYGLSCVGYDCRVDTVFRWPVAGVLDPKRPELAIWKEVTIAAGDFFELPPNSFVLASTVERFDLPRWIATTFVGKSTLARVAINPIVTPGEPGWRGHLTLEIVNNAPLPARIYAGEGIGQMLFWRLADEPATTYDRRAGASYQDQARGPVGARHRGNV